MKLETMQKLDDVAKACVAGLETEIACGLTTPEKVREVQSRPKNPTRLEVIKAMIRTDLKRAPWPEPRVRRSSRRSRTR